MENKLIGAEALLHALRDDADINGTNFARVKRHIEDAPAVDAIERTKYEALVEMYHELRGNFVDYVCSGVRNEAPYCLNKCEYCVDSRGWCKVEICQGFNPAEVLWGGERREGE